MIRVTQGSFYNTVCRLDVHPSIAGQTWDEVKGYPAAWKLRDGTQVGRTEGGTRLMESRYWVTPEFFRANESALVRLPEEAA
jgi:hypothetical protein